MRTIVFQKRSQILKNKEKTLFLMIRIRRKKFGSQFFINFFSTFEKKKLVPPKGRLGQNYNEI